MAVENPRYGRHNGALRSPNRMATFRRNLASSRYLLVEKPHEIGCLRAQPLNVVFPMQDL